MSAYSVAPLILVFPVAGLLFNALVGRRFVQPWRYGAEPQASGENDVTGEMWSGWVASIMALSSFLVALALFFGLLANGFEAGTVGLFTWINIPAAGFHIPWAIQVDTLSVTMMLVVAGVGSLIHIYAIGYMHGDPDFSRFFTYMNLFLFFMLILVTANNYLMLFVGWEGVGLCSFLLIGFWFDRVDEEHRPMNANAARKAFVANRVGDFAMIVAMILLFWAFGSLEFNTVFHSAEELFGEGQTLALFGQQLSVGAVLAAATTLFLVGATGKSAQIPLYVWLPDAMAGPTPVSALIHAATMVTSGIYLIVRSNVLFEIVREAAAQGLVLLNSPNLVAYIGAATALLAGIIAFTQFDIKKVLAYSTVSQLGFMIAAAGMGAYVAAMFHLITHAFFKALLFLSAGSVIHGVEHGHHASGHEHAGDGEHGDEADQRPFDPQDMRNMGGLRHQMRTTFWVYLIGALALSGFPPLAGFWSKDEILAHANQNMTVVYILLALAAACTAFYMGRQIKMVFFGEPRHPASEHAHESPPLMTVPLTILAFLATVGGFINLPFLSPAMAEAAQNHPQGVFFMLEGWLEHSIASFELSEAGLLHIPHVEPLAIDYVVAGLSIVLALAAFFLAFSVVYGRRPETATEPDPFRQIPVIGPAVWWFAVLPLNTFYVRVIIPAFDATARWLAYAVDWAFWHDFVHDNIFRDFFVGFAGFTSDVLDAKGLDGALVNGSARLTRWLAELLRRAQTGYVRNYALGLFLGVVLLLAYFLLMAG
ncbi:MAG TPA: NADH-quinone oxidoreductase subunit L [Candidatus Binatia bacterium]|nr:NADH-quinone oxidoreductase subunit L [Candidatus Binatia bacterium]